MPLCIGFDRKPSRKNSRTKSSRAGPQELELPSAPKQFLHYFEEDNMPQTRLHRDLEGDMAISQGVCADT
ncbi:MAG: hypothetical protein ACLRXC_12645 [[Clostridium] leptum]